jgi:periodic tryptophan protein 2
MNYTFANLLGAPYRGGSLLLRGDTLLCPAGNRVREVALRDAASHAHRVQVRSPTNRSAAS